MHGNLAPRADRTDDLARKTITEAVSAALEILHGPDPEKALTPEALDLAGACLQTAALACELQARIRRKPAWIACGFPGKEPKPIPTPQGPTAAAREDCVAIPLEEAISLLKGRSQVETIRVSPVNGTALVLVLGWADVLPRLMRAPEIYLAPASLGGVFLHDGEDWWFFSTRQREEGAR